MTLRLARSPLLRKLRRKGTATAVHYECRSMNDGLAMLSWRMTWEGYQKVFSESRITGWRYKQKNWKDHSGDIPPCSQ